MLLKQQTIRAVLMLLLPVWCCVPCLAQGDALWCVKPMVGVNLSRVTGDRLQFGTPPDVQWRSPLYRPGMALGADIECLSLRPLGLSVGLYFSQQGYRYNDYEDRHNPQVKLYYMQLPIMANLYVAEGLAFKIGVQPGLSVKQQFQFQDLDDENIIHSHDPQSFRDFDWGIPLGLSYNLEFLEFQVLYTFGRYDISSWQRAQPIHTRNISVTIGYRIEL